MVQPLNSQRSNVQRSKGRRSSDWGKRRTTELGGATFGAIGLLHLGSVWTARWRTEAVKQSGIFCYRDVVREWRDQQAA